MVAMVATIAAVAGTVTNVIGQARASQASKKAEAARLKQVQLESERKRREILRKQMVQRSRTLVGATAGGAQDGSGLLGAYAQGAGQAGYDLESQARSDLNSKTIFDANAQMAEAGELSAFGKGLSNLGAIAGSTEMSRLLGNMQATPQSGIGPFQTTVNPARPTNYGIDPRYFENNYENMDLF